MSGGTPMTSETSECWGMGSCKSVTWDPSIWDEATAEINHSRSFKRAMLMTFSDHQKLKPLMMNEYQRGMLWEANYLVLSPTATIIFS